jgi:type I restriction enzyme S subunit
MHKRLDDISKELKRELAALYGMRLIAILVFGSYARGEADEESDVDLLIVLDRVDHYGGEIDRTGGIVAQLSLNYGVSLSPVFVSEWDWRHGDTTFLANVREEAIAV